MKKINLFIVFAFCLLFVSCGNRQTVNWHEKAEKADAALLSVLENYDYVGGIVAVVRGNRVVYTSQFGVRNLETQEIISDTDLFRIASITKTFTAAAIMQLYEQGKLCLDDDVSIAFGAPIRNPRFPDDVITYRMLLSHTSSMSDAQGWFNFDILNPELNPNHADVFWDFAPGEEYRYCNLGFNLLGALVESHTGVRFDNFVRDNLLRPLGMMESGFNNDSINSDKFVSLYMRRDDAWVEANAYASPAARMENYILGRTAMVFSPTGGMKTSASELTTWMLTHMNFGTFKGVRILSEESARLMQTLVEPRSGTGIYGLGFMQRADFVEDTTLIGHTGNAYGLLSAMFFCQNRDFGIVLLTNGSRPIEGGQNRILEDIVSAMYQIFN